MKTFFKKARSLTMNNVLPFMAALSVVLGASLFLLSCGAGKNAASNKSKVINVGVTNDPASLNPIATTNTMANHAQSLLYLPLVAVNRDLGFDYRIAESISTNDNKTFTIKIRQGVRWTDGKPVTADDVIFIYNVYTDPRVGRNNSDYNKVEGTDQAGLRPQGIDATAGFKKIDDYTVSVTLKYPITQNVFNLTLGTACPLPKHIYENVPPENLRSHPPLFSPQVTNGPFKYKEYVPGQYISYVRNDDYYLGPPKIDAFNFKILTGAQITAQLESGEIDMNFAYVGAIPAEDYDRVQRMEHLRTFLDKPIGVQVLYFNCEFINNVKVRQAMDLAIDREGIYKNILKERGYLTKVPWTYRIEYFNEEASKYEYNPEKAKRLLAESGWDLNKRIVFAVPTGDTTRERVANILLESFKGIGLNNIVIEKADYATTLSNVQHNKYELSIVAMPEIPLNQIYYLRVYGSQRWTWTNFQNPRGDELLNIIETSIDPGTLKNAYYELEQLIADEVSAVCVYSLLPLNAVNKRVVQGEIPHYGPLLEIHQWDVE
ncbi:MAG: peptide ABC transporter substrate-binding protein [Spirochaetaceae bacterium]|jgi:peptide/nickel transport system substrate-binding protein|nr:peptide ABC transporter substrate-binding protein [Spirochaetaceae bacterium]